MLKSEFVVMNIDDMAMKKFFMAMIKDRISDRIFEGFKPCFNP